jgi:hypothetical protein
MCGSQQFEHLTSGRPFLAPSPGRHYRSRGRGNGLIQPDGSGCKVLAFFTSKALSVVPRRLWARADCTEESFRHGISRVSRGSHRISAADIYLIHT